MEKIPIFLSEENKKKLSPKFVLRILRVYNSHYDFNNLTSKKQSGFKINNSDFKNIIKASKRLSVPISILINFIILDYLKDLKNEK